jgi:acylphosphatase
VAGVDDERGTDGTDRPDGTDRTDGEVRARLYVRGRVQGVGFRWWTRSRARELGLVGHARNTADGRVEVVAQGAAEAVDALEVLLREEPSTSGRPGRVDAVVRQEAVPTDGTTGFVER